MGVDKARGEVQPGLTRDLLPEMGPYPKLCWAPRDRGHRVTKVSVHAAHLGIPSKADSDPGSAGWARGSAFLIGPRTYKKQGPSESLKQNKNRYDDLSGSPSLQIG